MKSIFRSAIWMGRFSIVDSQHVGYTSEYQQEANHTGWSISGFLAGLVYVNEKHGGEGNDKCNQAPGASD